MKTHPGFDKAQAYLHVQLGESRLSFEHRQSDGPYVTISRESGAGGSSLAQLLAERLDHELPGPCPWTIFDGNLIEFMLESNHLEPRLAQFLPEDRISEIDSSIGELVGLHPNLYQLVQRTNDIMRRLAQVGHVILVGRGANFACSHIENGVHVRVVASPPHRARHMSARQEISESTALGYNRDVDLARERYVRTTFNSDVQDPSNYDLVVNTGKMPLPQAADIVMALARNRFPAWHAA